jgi:S1-C subfamily serine protease
MRAAPGRFTIAAMDQSPSSSFADQVERAGAAVAGLLTRRRGAAGGVVWKDGAIVTTASAIGRADEVGVVGPDGQIVKARVRGADIATDLALVEADTAAFTGAPRRAAGASALRAGDAVFAVGREPSGLLHASFGRIGAAGPAWRTWRGGGIDTLIRLDGGLYPGLAGAAVADAEGAIVGIASPALARHHGVVLPWSTIDRIAAQLAASGRVTRGYLGIAAQPVQAPAAGGHGLLVAGMAEQSPAARGGLLVGDIILSAAGQRVADIDSLRALLAAQPAGSRIVLALSRGGQPLELAVDVGERAAPRWCH